MGSGSNTVTTNQSQQYTPAPAIGSAGTQALTAAGQAAQAPFQQPVAPVAPFTPFQNIGFGETLGMQGMAQPYFGLGANYLQGSAAPVTGQDVAGYYNPMAGNVMSQMQNLFGQQMRNLTGNATQQAGGVGADRIGVAQANLANQQGLAAGQTLANLYYPALQAAEQQKQMMAGAGYGLGQMGPAAQASQLQGIQALLGAGGQQQGLAQALMNAGYQQQLAQIAYPFQTAQYLAGITGGLAPAMGGTTTGQATTTYPQPSPLAQALGIGTAGLGMFGGLGGMGGMGGAGGKGSAGGIPGSNYFSPYMGMSPYSGTSGGALYQAGGATPSGSTTTAANVISVPEGAQEQLDAIYGTMPDLHGLPQGADLFAKEMAPIPQLRPLTPFQTSGTSGAPSGNFGNLAQLMQRKEMQPLLQQMAQGNPLATDVAGNLFQEGGNVVRPPLELFTDPEKLEDIYTRPPSGYQASSAAALHNAFHQGKLGIIPRQRALGGEAPDEPAHGPHGHLPWHEFESRFPKDAPPRDWMMPPSIDSTGTHAFLQSGGAIDGDGQMPVPFQQQAQGLPFPGAGTVHGSPVPNIQLQPGQGRSGPFGQYMMMHHEPMQGQQSQHGGIGDEIIQAMALTKGLGSLGAKTAQAPMSLLPTGYQDGGDVTPDQVRQAAYSAADQYNIPQDIFGRLINRESGFNPNAQGTSGEIGPAQIMPGTARDLTGDVRNPLENVRMGAEYLRQQYDKFGNWPQAVAAYNAGPGAVASGHIPFSTQRYASDVLGGQTPFATEAQQVIGPSQRPQELDWGQRMARSPWLSLVAAGAAMASTPGPIGSVIGRGLGAGATTLAGQRKALDTDENINLKAQRLQEMAQYHLMEIQRSEEQLQAKRELSAPRPYMVDPDTGLQRFAKPDQQGNWRDTETNEIIGSSSSQLGTPARQAQADARVGSLQDDYKKEDAAKPAPFGFDELRSNLIPDKSKIPSMIKGPYATAEAATVKNENERMEKAGAQLDAQRDQLTRLKQDFSTLMKDRDKDGFFTQLATQPGVGVDPEDRINKARMVNAAAIAAGRPPPFNPEKIAAVEEAIKIQKTMGMAFASTISPRDAMQMQLASISAQPGLTQSPAGMQRLIGLYEGLNNRGQDMQTFWRRWSEVNPHTARGFRDEFMAKNPVERDTVQAIVNNTPYQKAVKELPSMVKVLRENANNPEVVAKFDKLYGGTSSYFLTGHFNPYSGIQ